MRLASSRSRHAPSSPAASARACSGTAAAAAAVLPLWARGARRTFVRGTFGAPLSVWRSRASSTAAAAAYASQPDHHGGLKPMTTAPSTGHYGRDPSTAVFLADRRGHGSQAAPGFFDPVRGSPAAAIPSTRHYGSWDELLLDYHRLLAITRVPAPAADVATDVRFWAAIFAFAQRRGGDRGALLVWQEIFQRRQLCRVDGAAAAAFWQAVAETALRAATDGTDGTGTAAFLESTWAYAEWLHAEHGMQWPNYYRSVVLHMLRAGDGDGALRWHVRLSAHFAVPRRDFFDMLRGFLVRADEAGDAEADAALQDTLRAIYITSRHRQLYDTIVPLLWAHGQSARARAWRETLLRHGDRPQGDAARPFLQFLAGYYPEISLCDEEMALVHGRPAQYLAPAAAAGTEAAAAGGTTGGHPQPAALPTNLYHLMNLVHGETFGIQDKSTFNDRVGGRWFATTWVSLDTAIHLVYSLGVVEIGPLSLQSIALRERGEPAAVVRRLAQLDRHHISIGRSRYARAVRHLAQTGDTATLADLLHTPLHPDVFDDAVQQQNLLFRGGAVGSAADWKAQRLLLAVRLAVEQDDLVAVTNRLLLLAAAEPPGGTTPAGRRKTALRLLDEMAARGIEVLPSTAAALSQQTVAAVPRTFSPQAVPDVDFYAALCRRLLQLRLPVATEAWQNMLYTLGQQGRLAALESVALDLVERYTALQGAWPARTAAAPGTAALFKVHAADVPEAVRGHDQQSPGMVDVGYRLLPRDLPTQHPQHPLSLVFDQTLVGSIVRWYFYRKTAYRLGRGVRAAAAPVPAPAAASETDRPHGVAPAPPAAFALAGGIRLLALLQDRGVAVAAARVRAETLLCVAALFGPPALATRRWRQARLANQLMLGEVKALCDAAWGEAAGLLPPLEALERSLASLAAKPDSGPDA